MYAISQEVVNKQGEAAVVKATIIAEEAVTVMPTSGASVDNLPNTAIFAPGSSLLVVPTAEMFFFCGDGEWHLFGEEA